MARYIYNRGVTRRGTTLRPSEWIALFSEQNCTWNLSRLQSSPFGTTQATAFLPPSNVLSSSPISGIQDLASPSLEAVKRYVMSLSNAMSMISLLCRPKVWIWRKNHKRSSRLRLLAHNVGREGICSQHLGWIFRAIFFKLNSLVYISKVPGVFAFLCAH